jgi:hypothetical protein
MMTLSMVSGLGLVTSLSVVRSGSVLVLPDVDYAPAAAGTSPRERSSRQRETVRRSWK